MYCSCQDLYPLVPLDESSGVSSESLSGESNVDSLISLITVALAARTRESKIRKLELGSEMEEIKINDTGMGRRRER